jgi:hypothetical protein
MPNELFQRMFSSPFSLVWKQSLRVAQLIEQHMPDEYFSTLFCSALFLTWKQSLRVAQVHHMPNEFF